MAATLAPDVLEGVLSVVRADLDNQHERLRRMSHLLSTALSASMSSLDRIQEFSSTLVSPALGPLTATVSPSGNPLLLTSVDGAHKNRAPAAVCPPARPVKLFTRPDPSVSGESSPADSEDFEESFKASQAALVEASCQAAMTSSVNVSDCQASAPSASLEYSFRDPQTDGTKESRDLKPILPHGVPSRHSLIREDSPEDAVLLQLARTGTGQHLAPSRTGTNQHLAPSRKKPATLRSSTNSLVSLPFSDRHGFQSHGFETATLSFASSDGDQVVDRRNAIIRLCARLGRQSARGTICGQDIHNCLTALGIIRYAQEDIDDLIIQFKNLNHDRPKTPEVTKRKSTVGNLHVPFFSAYWFRRQYKNGQRRRRPDTNSSQKMELRSFAEVLLNDTVLWCLEPDYQQMSFTIREVLFSGDANRLVAELTHVRVDDVAAPPDKPDLITTIEPLLAFVIVMNGVFIGVQTGMGPDAAMFWGNLFFTTLFFLELLLRARTSGIPKYVWGPERWWNLFDVVLMIISFADSVLDALSLNFNLASISVLRVMRLTRLTRLLRIFRLRYMRELNLMVRGLLGGLYTLFWAVLLLFFTLYVIAVMATTTIGQHRGRNADIDRDELFTSLSRSILTSFRCFMGDCTTSDGKPIVQLLSMEYGISFVLFYLASMIFVVFGVFNLIVAVYIENTMNAAKTDGEKTKAERHRESVRVARLTRQLLKKFCAAQKLMASEDLKHSEVKNALRTSVLHDVGEAYTPISKEMFLCVIQDASVQKIMDDLDIPPERAYLFDVLDADSSGGLEVAELITGLLQVRGEAKKCDVVGALLAVRAVQGMLQEQDQRLVGLAQRLDRIGSCLTADPSGGGSTTPLTSSRNGQVTRRSRANKLDIQSTRFRDDEVASSSSSVKPSSRGHSKESAAHLTEDDSFP